MSNLPHLSPAETETAESEWFRLARLARARQGGSSNKDLQREVGVAFSGGGIRSATFNLGVLQALSEMKKLKQVGYISSVSGGSYINTWLAGWIHRDRFHNVDQALAKHADASTVNNWVDEQQPVFHLRRYSSYLTPQRGFMSSDVWAAVAAYVLRLLPNAGFVLLAAIALVALPYIERDLYRLIAGFDVEQQAGAYRAGLVQEIVRARCALMNIEDHCPSGTRSATQAADGESASAVVPPGPAKNGSSTKASQPPSVNAPGKLSAQKGPAVSMAPIVAKPTAVAPKPGITAASRDSVFQSMRGDAQLLQCLLANQAQVDAHAKPHKSAPTTANPCGELSPTLSDQVDRLKNSTEQFFASGVDPAPGAPALKTSILRLRNDLRWRDNNQLVTMDTGLPDYLTAFLTQAPSYTPESQHAHLALDELDQVLTANINALAPDSAIPPAPDDLSERLIHDPQIEQKTDCSKDWLRTAQQQQACLIVAAIDKNLPTIESEQVFSSKRIEELQTMRTKAEWLILATPVQTIFKVPATRWRAGFACAAVLAIFVYLMLSKKGKYDEENASKSRSAAGRHAFLTFSGMLLLAPALTTFWFRLGPRPFDKPHGLLVWHVALLVLFTVLCVSFYILSLRVRSTSRTVNRRDWRQLPAIVPAAAVGAVLFAASAWCLEQGFQSFDHAEMGMVLATIFGPLLLLACYLGMATVGVTLLRYESKDQEWMNRIWGDTALLCLLWTGVSVISLMWPYALLLLHTSQPKLPEATVIAGWVLTTLSGVTSAFSGKTGGEQPAASSAVPWRFRTKQASGQQKVLSVIAQIGPYAFVIGLLLIVSDSLSHWIGLDAPVRGGWADAALLGVATVLAIVVGRIMDVNRLSLHNFYRFRLIECYLAATENIDLQVRNLRATEDPVNPGTATGYDGPFPIVNCTLNVTRSGSLDLQKRKALNFIFTPSACGYTRLINKPPAEPPLVPYGKMKTEDCASDVIPSLTLSSAPLQQSPSIGLGAAMAISGAAQSPNQGNHTSPAVAALLTIFNVRLGWWLGNPRNDKTCRKESPKSGLGPILDELLAQATDEKKYVYLSDGGHFENLGIYELIRRKCKFIILSDADCDPHYRFDDLINAIELSRVDFGVQIEIPTDPLLNSGKSNWSRSPFVVGTVNYGDGSPGTILYLKSAVTRDNSVVVKKYDRDNATFPHESTANQWFDEMQFEAYRLLGLETATRAFRALQSASAPPWWDGGDQRWQDHVTQTGKLF